MDNTNRREIIKIDVNITGIEKVESFNSNVIMISFEGNASGEFFTGDILPGAIDTQQQISGSDLSLSARYMLSGRDFKNQSCRLFIENSGTLQEGDPIINATPKIITDSDNLKWLESSLLSSQIIPNKKGVQVLIYTNTPAAAVARPSRATQGCHQLTNLKQKDGNGKSASPFNPTSPYKKINPYRVTF